MEWNQHLKLGGLGLGLDSRTQVFGEEMEWNQNGQNQEKKKEKEKAFQEHKHATDSS